MEPTVTTNLDALKAALSPDRPDVIDIQGVPHIVTPAGWNVKEAEALLPQPRRIKRIAVAHDLRGFLAYVLAFKSDSTHLFAGDREKPQLEAKLDDHMPG